MTAATPARSRHRDEVERAVYSALCALRDLTLLTTTASVEDALLIHQTCTDLYDAASGAAEHALTRANHLLTTRENR